MKGVENEKLNFNYIHIVYKYDFYNFNAGTVK